MEISVDFATQNPHFTFDFQLSTFHFQFNSFPCSVFKRIGVWGKGNFFLKGSLPPLIFD